MNKELFLKNIEEALQTDEKLSFNTVLEDLYEWDSLSKMAVIAFIDKEFNKKIGFVDLEKYSTIADLANEVSLDD